MYDYIIKSVLIFLKTNEKNGLENDLEIRHTDTAVRPRNKLRQTFPVQVCVLRRQVCLCQLCVLKTMVDIDRTRVCVTRKVCARVRACVCLCLCLCLCLCMSVCVCVHACVRVSVPACACVCFCLWQSEFVHERARGGGRRGGGGGGIADFASCSGEDAVSRNAAHRELMTAVSANITIIMRTHARTRHARTNSTPCPH
jgi:hypothetical protein